MKSFKNFFTNFFLLFLLVSCNGEILEKIDESVSQGNFCPFSRLADGSCPKVMGKSPIFSIDFSTAALKGGTTQEISYQALYLSDLVNLELFYAADGVNFVFVDNLSESLSSYNWTVPNDNVTTAKLMMSATNGAGATTSLTTSFFTIDSTAPNAPAVILDSPAYTNSTTTTLSVSDCTDRPYLFIGEGGAPLASDNGWVSCSTTSGAFQYILGSSVNESKDVKVWAKDTVGNISAPSNISVVFDNTDPVLTFLSAPSGVNKGGEDFVIEWELTEQSVASTQDFSLEYFDGTTWNAIADVPAADGPLNAEFFSHTWTMPLIDTDSVRIRLSFSDLASLGQVIEGPDFIIDSVPPELTAASMSVNSGATTTKINYVKLSLSSTDAQSNITKFCLKYNNSTAPDSTAGCWIAVDNPTPGLTPAKSITLTDFDYPIGLSAGTTYTIYVWVMDEAGHISTLTNAGVGTDGQDRVGIQYLPGSPPVITDVMAVNTESPASNPPGLAEMTISSGNNVYIKWKASDDEALPASPVTIKYTLDDTNWTTVASGLADGDNGCQTNHAGTAADDDMTGCYLWTAGSPTNNYYKIKVEVTDEDSMTSSSTSLPLNVSTIRIVAGNTDPGIGASAKSSVLYPRIDNVWGGPDHYNLVVSPDGTIFFRDVSQGIIKISPLDGKAQVYLPMGANITGDGGLSTNATAKFITRIAWGFDHGLLIWDEDRIRKIDLQTNIINTLLGGGALTADGALASEFFMSRSELRVPEYNGAAHQIYPLPNGDIYFSPRVRSTVTSLTLTPDTGYKIWKYNHSDGRMYSITPSGTGYSAGAGVDFGNCYPIHFRVGFNAQTSEVTHLQLRLQGNNGWAPSNCVGGDGVTFLDPETGVVTGTDWGVELPGVVPFVSPNGDIYVNQYGSRIHKYNPVTKSWTHIAGNGSNGYCEPNNALAINCPIDLRGFFVDQSNNVFIVDRNQIRVIDNAGKLQDVAGQSLAFGDSGKATSARFNDLMWFEKADSGNITLMDIKEFKIREVNGANQIMKTVLGNGAPTNPLNGTTAFAAGFRTTTNGNHANFVLDPVTEDIYMAPTHGRFMKFDRDLGADGTWVQIAGQGAVGTIDNDGNPGSDYMRTETYLSMQGWDGTNFYAGGSSYAGSNYTRGTIKKYDKDTGTQSHVIGANDTIERSGHFTTSPDGPITTTTPAFPSALGLVRDNCNNQFIMSERGAVKKFRTIKDDVLGTLTTINAGYYPQAFAYNCTDNIIYFCHSNGLIYKKDVTAGTPSTAISWPIASMKCQGNKMYYDHASSSLFFLYIQNGLHGLAEHLNP